MSLPENAVVAWSDDRGRSFYPEWDNSWDVEYIALPRFDFDAQEARIAAVLSAVEEIDERLRLDGSALCLSEVGPLLDAARALRSPAPSTPAKPATGEGGG